MIVSACIWLGLLAAYSRGPWIGAILIFFAFAALGPRPLPRLLKTASIVAAVGCTIALSPLGDKILSVLPFMGGTVDSGSAPTVATCPTIMGTDSEKTRTSETMPRTLKWSIFVKDLAS